MPKQLHMNISPPLTMEGNVTWVMIMFTGTLAHGTPGSGGGGEGQLDPDSKVQYIMGNGHTEPPVWIE